MRSLIRVILAAFFCLCLTVLIYTWGVVSANFAWYPAPYLSQITDALKSQIEYSGLATEDFSFDESLLEQATGNTDIGPKYTLLSLRHQSKVWALDEHNRIIHTWSLPYSKAFPMRHSQRKVRDNHVYIEKFVTFPNGDLLATYTGWGDTPYGYGLVKMDKDSHVIWNFFDTTNHDIFVHPDNQNIYTLTHQFIVRAGKNTLADYIALLSPDGKLLKKISVLDAFDKSSFRDLLTNKQPQGAAWDTLHTNSIDVIDAQKATAFPQFKLGSILISIRNMDTIAVIDPHSEEVIWAYSGIWSAQHAAHFTKRGTIILLDNNGGGTRKKPQSRIIEINPATLTVKTLYAGSPTTPFYTCAFGRTQPLDNGNIIVTETLGSRIFEINPAGEMVWQYKLKPFYQPHVPDIAPYGKNERKYDADYLCADHNLATAIVSSTRYSPAELPFLQGEVK